MSQLTCKKCGAELHAGDVDFEALRATCRLCGWQVGGAKQGAYREGHLDVPAPAAEEEPKALAKTATLPLLPEEVTVKRDATGVEHLEVEVRPVKLWRVPLISLLLGGKFLLGAWMNPEVAHWIVAGWLVTVWLLGLMLANIQTVAVRRGKLSVSYRPFPRLSKTIDVARLDQLWVDQIEDNKGYVTFRLHARIKTGGDVTILSGLEDPAGALYLEQRIEEMLGITDRPVLGEMKTHTRA